MKILTASLINKYILNNPNSLQINSNKYIDQNISENNLMCICYIIQKILQNVILLTILLFSQQNKLTNQALEGSKVIQIKIKSNKLCNVQGTLTCMFITIFLDMKISKIHNTGFIIY